VDTMDLLMTIYVAIGIIVWVVVALACAWLAGQKGRDKITWGLLGFILGFLALILIAVAPSKGTTES